MAERKPLIRLLAALALVALAGCAGVVTRGTTPRVSQLSGGDDVFRASQDFVVAGLDAEIAGDSALGVSQYERALQVDASNPWAYLALARHYVEVGEARSALAYVDRAAGLLESLDLDSPGARLHCDGLRGAALALQGRDREARVLLDAAARGAPAVWGDGQLSAAELR